MYSIWKYEIEPDLVNQVYRMPAGAQLISAGVDPQGKMCFWAQVNTGAALCDHLVSCIGTGWDMSNMLSAARRQVKFVGTIVKGEYVWHVFDLGEGVKGRLEE